MGLFGKKEKVECCDMCDVTVSANETSSHRSSHIVKIGPTEPQWLSSGLRAVAQGQYTFRCQRCDSYPDIKWPHEGGADAGMTIHLGVAHRNWPVRWLKSGRQLPNDSARLTTGLWVTEAFAPIPTAWRPIG